MKTRLLGAALVALLLAITQQAALAVMSPSYIVFFDYGRTALSAQGEKTIAEFVHWHRRDAWQVAVYGFSDIAESSEALIAGTRRSGATKIGRTGYSSRADSGVWNARQMALGADKA